MSAKKAGKTRTKTAGKTAAVSKRPQPHGGALLAGGVPGNKGGIGRTPSELRARLVGTFAERVGVIEDIADGKPVKRVQVPLGVLLKHAACPKCGDAFKPTGTPDDLVMITIDGLESASPGDRIRALDLAGKYGLGTKDEITLVSPDVQGRVQRMVDVIASRPTWDSPALLAELSPIFQP